MSGQGRASESKPRYADADASSTADLCDRRSSTRHEVLWSVDCDTEETFLYAAITNISEMGIFVQTSDPLAIGSEVTLRFAPLGEGRGEPFVLGGVVQWVNLARASGECLNPGMGVRFTALSAPDRERIVEVIHTIAYLREDPCAPSSRSPQASDN